MIKAFGYDNYETSALKALLSQAYAPCLDVE